MKKILYLLIPLLLTVACVAGPQPTKLPPTPVATVVSRPGPRMTLNPEDPSRLLLPLNEGLTHSMVKCGERVSVTTTFQGFNEKGEAIINGKPYPHGARLIVEPQNCKGKIYDVGWINIIGDLVYYQAEDDREVGPEREPLRAEIGGHKLIVTAVAQSLEEVRIQGGLRGYKITEGVKKCVKTGEKYPFNFEIKDASLGNNLWVFGHAEGEVQASSGTPQIYGVFIRYAGTSKWGFLPVFYSAGTKEGECSYIIPLTLSGPTSTIPASPPEGE